MTGPFNSEFLFWPRLLELIRARPHNLEFYRPSVERELRAAFEALRRDDSAELREDIMCMIGDQDGTELARWRAAYLAQDHTFEGLAFQRATELVKLGGEGEE